jgi:hypothetical protein
LTNVWCNTVQVSTAKVLNIPLFITEQYPQALGNIGKKLFVVFVQSLIENDSIIED